MPRPSGTAHTPWRANFSRRGLADRRVADQHLAGVGRIRPLMTLSRVDLPAPLGPRRANTLPGGTTRSTPWSTSMRP